MQRDRILQSYKFGMCTRGRDTPAGAEPDLRGCCGVQVDESYADVRVVGGENMADERPLTEGLELFDTGVEVSMR